MDLLFTTLFQRFFHSGSSLLGCRHQWPQFKRYLAAVGIFGIGDFSHSLLILAATQLLTGSMGVIQAAQVAGLLYVWRNVVQVAVSFPIGVLADRFGHMPTLVAGYVLGVLTAVLTAAAFALHIDSIVFLGMIFLIAGLYMAVQEALESTVTAEMVSQELLATAVGALGTVNGIAKFISSTVVGVLWTAISPVFSFGLAAAYACRHLCFAAYKWYKTNMNQVVTTCASKPKRRRACILQKWNK